MMVDQSPQCPPLAMLEDKRWLVLAPYGDLGESGRCFDRDLAYRVPGGSLFPAIGERARACGMVPLTVGWAQIALERGARPREIRMISEMGAGMSSRPFKGASHKTLISLESPLQSKLFHLRLKQLSGQFDTAFLYDGLLGFSRSSVSNRIYFPIGDREGRRASIPIEGKNLLVAVVGNKSPFAWSTRRQIGMLRALIRDLVFLAVRRISPVIGAKNYYKVRRRLIEDCSRYGKIDVYGSGWETLDRKTGVRSWRGVIENSCAAKISMIGKYRFCLCIENCAFPGYITEKIYDCFIAGVVPIYMGAPDIKSRISPDAFIDCRRFLSAKDMLDHISGLDARQVEGMLLAGSGILKSDEFRSTDPEGLAKKMIPRD